MATKMPKEAAAASAPTAPAPTLQSTLPETVKLPCAREYFFQLALTAWGYCRANRELFVAESDRYTEEFIDDQVALILSVKLLPDLGVRLAAATEANQVLIVWRQQVGSLSKRLTNAINYAFKDAATAESERQLAGLTDYGVPSAEPWGPVDAFLTKANEYLRTKMEVLIAAKAAKENLKTQFSNTATAFSAAWADFIAKEKAVVDGTKPTTDGLKAILEQLMPMLNEGKVIFEFDPVNRKKFTIKDLVREVRGTNPGGVKGFVKLNAKPRMGVQVEIVGMEDKFTFTDKKGRYELSVAAGTYAVRFTSNDTLPLTIEGRKVTAGVKGLLSVELQPVPVVETLHATSPNDETSPNATSQQSTYEAAPTDSNGQLSGAILEMAKQTEVTNGAVNGTAA